MSRSQWAARNGRGLMEGPRTPARELGPIPSAGPDLARGGAGLETML